MYLPDPEAEAKVRGRAEVENNITCVFVVLLFCLPLLMFDYVPCASFEKLCG